ncbi:hypothetical protein Syun_025109 [Stephania yunnanensis]|uniref:Uncharacterized protein n=1 Tax=Stephania yunnanensis TaxID=152371 RepID=A0AAP0EZU9_9MAGN
MKKKKTQSPKGPNYPKNNHPNPYHVPHLQEAPLPSDVEVQTAARRSGNGGGDPDDAVAAGRWWKASGGRGSGRAGVCGEWRAECTRSGRRLARAGGGARVLRERRAGEEWTGGGRWRDRTGKGAGMRGARGGSRWCFVQARAKRKARGVGGARGKLEEAEEAARREAGWRRVRELGRGSAARRGSEWTVADRRDLLTRATSAATVEDLRTRRLDSRGGRGLDSGSRVRGRDDELKRDRSRIARGGWGHATTARCCGGNGGGDGSGVNGSGGQSFAERDGGNVATMCGGGSVERIYGWRSGRHEQMRQKQPCSGRRLKESIFLKLETSSDTMLIS